MLAREEGQGSAPAFWLVPRKGIAEVAAEGAAEVAAPVSDTDTTLALYQQLLARTDSLRRELRALTTLDPTTTIPPWLVILERLHVEVERALRHARDLSVIVVEVDDLASLRDVKGDAAAVEALGHLATHIRSGLRVSDELGQLAGGAFLVLCPETDAAGAGVVASRIVGSGSRINVTICGMAVPLSVSVGVAVLTPSLDSAGLLVGAFAALGRARRAGGGWTL